MARIAFTGGPTAARHVVRNAAENFAEVSLELGGKSPFIVFEDANIESAVNGSVAGIFGATGQSCVAGSRLYLHEDIADDFLSRMVEIAQNIRIGDPQDDATEMGPLCTAGQLDHIQHQVTLAQQEGGKLLTGGAQPDLGGLYFQPTIIDCPRQDLSIVDTELFGPVLAVQRFKTEDEALALANDTEHGLAAGIFSRQRPRPSHGQAHPRRHRLGQHLSRHQPNRGFRRPQGLWLRARGRVSGHLRLYPPQNRLDEPFGCTACQPIPTPLRTGP